jgi:hypothetical protein
MSQKTLSSTRLWISWWETMTEDEDWRPLTVPTHASGIVGYWGSGFRIVNEGEEDQEAQESVCAVIEARSEKAAQAMIGQFWQPVEWRFCEAQEKDWLPEPTRFTHDALKNILP